MNARKQIVVIGANFGGLTAAMRLPRRHSVLVIDPRPSFEFLPNIHELISGVKSPEQLRLSRGRLLRRAGHQFVEDTVTGIDPAAGLAVTSSGNRLLFDICVVAVGGVNNTRGVPGADLYAMPFKCVDDCKAIGDALRRKIQQQSKVSVVVVGGGLEGVESLGEILRRYRGNRGISVHVVESGERLLPALPASVGRDIERCSRPYSVQFHTGSKVKAVTRRAVELEPGNVIPSDLTIWTGGAKPPGILADAGLAPQEGGWAPVRNTLQSTEYDNIFVIGDAAELPGRLRKQSYHAISMGERVADNIDRLVRGVPLQPFKPSFDLSLIAFGDLNTYLAAGRSVVAGTSFAPLKEFIYQFNMARYDPPLSVTPFLELQKRYWNGIRKLGLPTVLSPRSLARLSRVRILR